MSAQLIQFPHSEWTPKIGDLVLWRKRDVTRRGVVISSGDIEYGQPVFDVRLAYSGEVHWARADQLEPLLFWDGGEVA